MTLSPALRSAFSARLARRNARIAETGRAFGPAGADYCLDKAREDVRFGRDPMRALPERLEHGSVIRSRTSKGERRTYAVAILPDDTMGAPWIEHDGHGIIREVAAGRTDRWAGGTGKRPGEVLFSGDHSGATTYAYDVAATIAKAREEGWGLGPDALADLERRAGRKATRKMIVAEAVRLDLERCRGWLRDEWSWIGVALIEMPRGEELDPQYVADVQAGRRIGMDSHFPIAASLWGIESDSPDYHASIALELLSEANANA